MLYNVTLQSYISLHNAEEGVKVTAIKRKWKHWLTFLKCKILMRFLSNVLHESKSIKRKTCHIFCLFLAS